MLASWLCVAAWSFVPGWLRAHRGSHVVITTIMFNFLASALMVHLLVNVLIEPGQMSPESREFAPTACMPFVHDALAGLGIEVARSPLNLSILRSEEHTSELQSLMRNSYAVFFLKKINTY